MSHFSWLSTSTSGKMYKFLFTIVIEFQFWNLYNTISISFFTILFRIIRIYSPLNFFKKSPCCYFSWIMQQLVQLFHHFPCLFPSCNYSLIFKILIIVTKVLSCIDTFVFPSSTNYSLYCVGYTNNVLFIKSHIYTFDSCDYYILIDTWNLL